MSEKPKFDLAVCVYEDIIRLSIYRQDHHILCVELKPSMAQHWSDAINRAVDEWEKRMMKNVSKR